MQERIMGGYVSSAGSGYLVKNKEKYVSVCKNATNCVLPSQSFSIQKFFQSKLKPGANLPGRMRQYHIKNK